MVVPQPMDVMKILGHVTGVSQDSSVSVAKTSVQPVVDIWRDTISAIRPVVIATVVKRDDMEAIARNNAVNIALATVDKRTECVLVVKMVITDQNVISGVDTVLMNVVTRTLAVAEANVYMGITATLAT